MATLQSGKCFTVPTLFGMCCRSEWQERMYIYKWHEVDQTKHEIFCVHIVCNEIQVKVNLEITTFIFLFAFSILSQLFLIWGCNMEVKGAPELLCFPHSLEYLPLCSAEQIHSYRFGTTWGWVNDNFHFWVNYPFNTSSRKVYMQSHTGFHRPCPKHSYHNSCQYALILMVWSVKEKASWIKLGHHKRTHEKGATHSFTNYCNTQQLLLN